MRELTLLLFIGPNAISVSLSPMGRYVMVGLASRRILLHPTTEHMVAQVFRLQQPHGGETSMRVSICVLYFCVFGSSLVVDCWVMITKRCSRPTE